MGGTAERFRAHCCTRNGRSLLRGGAAVVAGTTTRGRQRRAYRPVKPLSRVPTEEQVSEALHASHVGIRGLRSDRHDNCMKLFRLAREWWWAHERGEAVSCRVVIAQKMGYAVTDQDDADRHWSSIWRYARQLELAGVLVMREQENSRGAAIGVRLELLDGWLTYTDAPSASSSAGCCDGISRPRREHYRRHRFAPRRIAGGRGSPPLYFFHGSYRERNRPSPTGTSKQLTTQAHAHEPRGAAGVGAALDAGDAIERACPPGHRAALWRWRTAGTEQEPPAALQAAADSGALDAVPAGLAAWSLRFPGREPRFSTAAAAQLERSAAQLDRLWSPGAGAGWIVAAVLASDDEDRHQVRQREPGGALVTRGRPIASLAYFVNGLRLLAREQKRKRRHGEPRPKHWRPRRPGGYDGWLG